MRHRAKIEAFINEHLNDRDPTSPPPDFPISSQVDGELRELRVRFAGVRYRILYQRSGNLLVLLHAFVKSSESIPGSDKALAQKRMADFKRRMDSRRKPRAVGRDAPR